MHVRRGSPLQGLTFLRMCVRALLDLRDLRLEERTILFIYISKKIYFNSIYLPSICPNHKYSILQYEQMTNIFHVGIIENTPKRLIMAPVYWGFLNWSKG